MSSTAAKPNMVVSLPHPLALSFTGVDLRNIAVIFAGFVGVLLLIPPARIYPVTDDWIYSQSVTDLVSLAYKPHDWTQPIAIGHLAWGAVFAALFGNTFTVLTLANLAMSIASLVTFYLLLRQLNVSSGPALLGVAILGFNPLYVYLSYSFMTDITFLFYILVASLLYIRGLQGYGSRWLWLGGVATALAYLTRQYGILVVVAALAYLWISRRWSWKDAIAIAAPPLAAAAGYAIWQHFQPSPLIDVQMNMVHDAILADPLRYLNDRVARLVWLAPVLGLSLAPLVRLPRRPVWALPFFAVIVYYQFRSLTYAGSIFPQNGNVVDNSGLLMYAYDANPVWNQGVWALLGIAGGLLFSLWLVRWIGEISGYIRSKPWRNSGTQDASFVPLALAFMMAVTVLVATPFLLDRYWLALLPLLMIPELRRLSVARTESRTEIPANTEGAVPQRWERGRTWRWIALLPVALFSLIALRDFKEHATLRWQTAENLVSQGVKVSQINAGIEWDGLYNFKDGAQRIRETGDLTYISYPYQAVMDPIYAVNDLPIKGYEEVGSTSYRSWLDGGATKRVLVLKRK